MLINKAYFTIMEEHMTDQEIIKQVKQGDIEQFAFIVERYHRPLLGFINTITRNPTLSEDIGQMVFLAFFKTLESFDENLETPISAWLFATARNMAINTIRKERRLTYIEKPETLDHSVNDTDPAAILIKKSDKETLHHCLNILEEPYRSTLIESLKGSSIEEIARNKDVLPGTIKSRLYRARQKCASLFRAKCNRGNYD